MRDLHYKMDYSRPVGKEATWVCYSLDRHKYPEDPRGLTYVKQQGEHGLTSPQIVYLEGKRFQYTGGMFASNFINIFRYEGEMAVPSGVIMQWDGGLYRTSLTWPPDRPKGPFLWRDKNGDGHYQADEYAANTDRIKPGPFYVDEKGNIWMAYGFPGCSQSMQALDFRLEEHGRAFDDPLVRAWWNDTGFAGQCPQCGGWIHFTIRAKTAITAEEAAKYPQLPENWHTRATIL